MTTVLDAGQLVGDLEGASPREAFRRALVELARRDPRIYCIDSDVGGFEESFGAELPEQYVNVGIAEANLVGVAAGLAASGKIPFVSTIATLLVMRGADQLKIDVAGSALPVKIVVTHGGFSAGHLGPTHHSLEDLALMRALPNVTVIVPADAAQAVHAVVAAVELEGPVYLRLGRNETDRVPDGGAPFVVGQVRVLRPGGDVAIAGCGTYPLLTALAAAARLEEEGVDARVLDVHTLQPLDWPALVLAAQETAGIVAVEDHGPIGGLRSAIAEVVSQLSPCPVVPVGIEYGFHDHVGNHRQLLEAAGLTTDHVTEAARMLAARARSQSTCGNMAAQVPRPDQTNA